MDASQRAALSAVLGELANLAAAALVLGQVLEPQALSWWSLSAGMSLWAVFVSVAVLLARRER